MSVSTPRHARRWNHRRRLTDALAAAVIWSAFTILVAAMLLLCCALLWVLTP